MDLNDMLYEIRFLSKLVKDYPNSGAVTHKDTRRLAELIDKIDSCMSLGMKEPDDWKKEVWRE
jgi:hypothetical protein